MPFVHQVSTISLLRTKLHVAPFVHKWPHPSSEEIYALVALLGYRSSKLAAILPFTLALFARVPGVANKVLERRKDIILGLDTLFNNITAITEMSVKPVGYSNP